MPAAASLAGLPVRHAGRLLTALADSCLVTERSRQYVLHDLLRMYAAELAGTANAAGETQAAEDRLFGHYLHSAHSADRMLDPHRDPIALPPPVRGVSPNTPRPRERLLPGSQPSTPCSSRWRTGRASPRRHRMPGLGS